MKKLISLALLTISIPVFSQVISVNELDVLENQDEPYYRCTHKLVIDEEANDTTETVSILFYKNNNYSDLVTIQLDTKEIVKQFTDDLLISIKSLQNNKATICHREEYKLSISEGKVLLGHKKDFGNILLELKYAEDILKWMKTIRFVTIDLQNN